LRPVSRWTVTYVKPIGDGFYAPYEIYADVACCPTLGSISFVLRSLIGEKRPQVVFEGEPFCGKRFPANPRDGVTRSCPWGSRLSTLDPTFPPTQRAFCPLADRPRQLDVPIWSPRRQRHCSGKGKRKKKCSLSIAGQKPKSLLQRQPWNFPPPSILHTDCPLLPLLLP
jgi:hypothetical protein